MSGMRTELVVIRRAEATDLSKVETVARTTWPVAYAGIIPDAVQQRLLERWYSPESSRGTLAVQGSSFFVAESRGEVIGFAQFVRRSAESAELTRIYVWRIVSGAASDDSCLRQRSQHSRQKA